MMDVTTRIALWAAVASSLTFAIQHASEMMTASRKKNITLSLIPRKRSHDRYRSE